MYTIGEFSKLSHISARMLRHYDAIGLLRPAHTGVHNGYRYYDPAQLATLLQIETLKSYGFTLAQIPELLVLSQVELAQRIHAQRLKAYEELHNLRKTLRRMEDEIIKMEGKSMVQDKYKVIVMNTPAQKVFGIRRKVSIAEIHELFQELLAETGKRGLVRAGATQLLYLGEEFSYENMEVEAQVQVSGEHADIKELPAQLCAATTHMGPYESVKEAYDAICAWLADNPEYKVCGPAIERYIKDENSVSDPDELETGILFPVVRG
ncbi:MAG: putative bacterial transcription activator [Eubacterium sp.]|nr:putative bacterial transcription activator [Eubacterium sp.]